MKKNKNKIWTFNAGQDEDFDQKKFETYYNGGIYDSLLEDELYILVFSEQPAQYSISYSSG